MSVIATLAIPADEFTLGEAVATNPGITVRLVRVVPVGGRLIPYFWAGNGSTAEVTAALRAEDDIDSFEVVDTVEDEVLIRVDWTDDVDGFVGTLATAEATILEGRGEAGTWTFQLRFDEHSQLTAFYRQCVAQGITVDVQEVHGSGHPAQTDLQLGLTDIQQETLVTALESGYFAVPRETNLDELASELGVSDTAVSQRIRRGVSNLLTTTLSRSEEDS